MEGTARREQPKVSVIVPIYKVEKYLVQCLESVAHQTLEELEIILVDDGQQDRCREIIDFYEQTDPRVIAIHEPNPGFSYGAKLNRGLDRATGEFIGIVESDDFIGPDMYEQMYECAVRTGANIVKTPFYKYESKDNNEVDKSRNFLNANVPKEKPFSIFQFPHMLAMHPSIWSAIYRREELRRHGIRFTEAPGAGYVDNDFFVDVYVKLGKIVWLNKPFYRWRTSSETSSSQPEHWKHDVMLERWNRNLDVYPPDAEENQALVPAFVTQAYGVLLSRYLEGWTFNERQYEALTAYLRRFSEEQLLGAMRMADEKRRQLVQCRNDPEGFRAEYFPSSLPEPEKKAPEPVKAGPASEEKAPEPAKAGPAPEKKVPKPEKKENAPMAAGARAPERKEPSRRKGRKDSGTAVFRGAVYLLLLAMAVRVGAFGGLLPEAVCGPLAAACAVLSVLCVPVVFCVRRRK